MHVPDGCSGCTADSELLTRSPRCRLPWVPARLVAVTEGGQTPHSAEPIGTQNAFASPLPRIGSARSSSSELLSVLALGANLRCKLGPLVILACMSMKQPISKIEHAKIGVNRARIVFGILGAVALGAIVIGRILAPPIEPLPQLSAEELRLQMEQAGAEKAERQAQTLELNHVIQGGRALRDTSHNPKRFETVMAVSMSNGTGCYEFRAENGFGVLRSGQAVLYNGKVTVSHQRGFWKLWNAHCANRTGIDVTGSIR